MWNRPIESTIRSHRFAMEEPIYHTCWAFMRELRTHNDTKRIYAIDPYAEVYRFRDNLYGIFSDNIDGKGDAWSYLILGPQKALLIDTSFGLGNLKGLVQELIGDRELLWSTPIPTRTIPEEMPSLTKYIFWLRMHRRCADGWKSRYLTRKFLMTMVPVATWILSCRI